MKKTNPCATTSVVVKPGANWKKDHNNHHHHRHHHHQSLNREGRRGTTDAFTTRFFKTKRTKNEIAVISLKLLKGDNSFQKSSKSIIQLWLWEGKYQRCVFLSSWIWMSRQAHRVPSERRAHSEFFSASSKHRPPNQKWKASWQFVTKQSTTNASTANQPITSIFQHVNFTYLQRTDFFFSRQVLHNVLSTKSKRDLSNYDDKYLT